MLVIAVAGVPVRVIVLDDTLSTVPISVLDESYILFPFPISVNSLLLLTSIVLAVAAEKPPPLAGLVSNPLTFSTTAEEPVPA